MFANLNVPTELVFRCFGIGKGPTTVTTGGCGKISKKILCKKVICVKIYIVFQKNGDMMVKTIVMIDHINILLALQKKKKKNTKLIGFHAITVDVSDKFTCNAKDDSDKIGCPSRQWCRILC